MPKTKTFQIYFLLLKIHKPNKFEISNKNLKLFKNDFVMEISNKNVVNFLIKNQTIKTFEIDEIDEIDEIFYKKWLIWIEKVKGVYEDYLLLKNFITGNMSVIASISNNNTSSSYNTTDTTDTTNTTNTNTTNTNTTNTNTTNTNTTNNTTTTNTNSNTTTNNNNQTQTNLQINHLILKLTKNIHIKIKFDFYTFLLPEFTIYSDDKTVENYLFKISKNINNWNFNKNIINNLEMLFECYFTSDGICIIDYINNPMDSRINNTNNTNNNTQNDQVFNVESNCAICYLCLYHENKQLIQCSDCLTNYHNDCLISWFKMSPSINTSFKMIIGNCVYCNSSIACKEE